MCIGLTRRGGAGDERADANPDRWSAHQKPHYYPKVVVGLLCVRSSRLFKIEIFIRHVSILSTMASITQSMNITTESKHSDGFALTINRPNLLKRLAELNTENDRRVIRVWKSEIGCRMRRLSYTNYPSF
jgi:hypothetical protein